MMFNNLEHDWANFVMRHLCPTNFFYHLLSVILFWSGPVLFFMTGNWYYWGLFFLSGPIGSIGHVIGTDPGINFKEATHSPMAAMMATYMVIRVILGQYHKDVARATAFYESGEYQSPRPQLPSR
ncbi:MAG: hypothetical protein MI976_22480 [Pseudomonadales bacterium]|nr:hypothetical protein [Pseudomonadales bacterium]